MLKTNTIALIVGYQAELPVLLDTLSNEGEIQLMENALRSGQSRPLEQIYENRVNEAKREDEMGDYIEELLSQAVVKPEIQQHGIQWMKSKIKIEKYQKAEKEAAQVIAGYAYKIFQLDRSKVDFLLTGPNSQVRVRIFEIT